MATIFYKTGGDFSTLTPQKVTAVGAAPISAGFNSYDVLTSERTAAFTPTDAGSATGAFIFLRISTTGTQDPTVTVKLQENVASVWTDRATATVAVSTLGSARNSVGGFGYCNGAYIAFSSPYSVTTSASTWRIAVSASGTGNGNVYLWKNGSTYCYGLILATTTSYGSGDDIFFAQNQTFSIDQNVTFTNAYVGGSAIIGWVSSPASSYTLSGTTAYWSYLSGFSVGTALAPIPYAQQAIITITNNWLHVNIIYVDGLAHKLNLYGEKPTYYQSTLAQSANGSQAVIVTSEDMSAYWSVGDTISVGGGAAATGTCTEEKVIQSISGTSVTFTTNLTAKHWAGASAVNITRARLCGVYFTSTGTNNWSGAHHATCTLVGCRLSASIGTGTYDNYWVVAQSTPTYLDTCFFEATYLFTDGRAAYSWWYAPTYKNVFFRRESTYTSNSFRLTSIVNATIENIVVHGTGGGTYHIRIDASVNSTITNTEVSNFTNNSTPNIRLYSNKVTVSNMRIYQVSTAGYGLELNSNYSSITNLTIQGACLGGVLINGGVGTTITNSNVGGNVATTYTNWISTSVFGQITYYNSTFNAADTFAGNIANAIDGASITSDTHNATSNNHLTEYIYGRLASSGSGLTDTTVHTAGSGKFAIRFEPTSSSNNLTWEFNVPTGNIQNKTMTISVWCKINSATYYAGTHQLPRLTIDYDNGTTAYHQAGETTDWQLLLVAFTPTTTYGQITVTLSGRTDATTTDAYIYFDDFGIAYPPSVSLDLGGMDNWANALPVIPPIALPISAGTVAQNVWTQLSTTDWGTDTMGEKVKKPIKYIVDGEIPL